MTKARNATGAMMATGGTLITGFEGAMSLEVEAAVEAPEVAVRVLRLLARPLMHMLSWQRHVSPAAMQVVGVAVTRPGMVTVSVMGWCILYS